MLDARPAADGASGQRMMAVKIGTVRRRDVEQTPESAPTLAAEIIRGQVAESVVEMA